MKARVCGFSASLLTLTCVFWGLTAGWANAGDSLFALPAQPTAISWPTDRWPVALGDHGADPARLEAALESVYEVRGNAGVPETRALLVIQGGRIVVEHYAEDFDATSKFRSWSMAKSITQALVGVLSRQGKIDVDAAAPVSEWRNDDRARITVTNLLHMSAGFDGLDGGSLLYVSRDGLRGFVRGLPAKHAPGSHWAYSTASSLVLASIVDDLVGPGREAMLAFMRSELFEPLGVRSAVPEFDHQGLFLGGSSVWANARDWARLGLLFLRDGVWDGRRVLPAGWVDFSRTPTAAPNMGNYGAHVWLNHPRPDGSTEFPGAPSSVFNFGGASGQFVIVVPTHDLVVVRLGETQTQTEREIGARLGAVIQAFPLPESRK